MSRHFARLAAVALVGTMLATAPGFAAPPTGGPGAMGGPGGPPNCADPNSKDPACLKMGHHRRGNGPQGGQNSGPPSNGPGQNSNGPGQGNNGPGQGNMNGQGPTDHNGPPPMNHRGPPGNWNGPGNNGNWNGPGRDQWRHGHPPFHSWMRSFNFPMFARPFFDVRPGIVVPRSYRVRPVPPEILWYYPQYAGYFYFIGRHGEIVIVSPRSLRIIAILD